MKKIETCRECGHKPGTNVPQCETCFDHQEARREWQRDIIEQRRVDEYLGK